MVKFKKVDEFSYIIEEGLSELIAEAQEYVIKISHNEKVNKDEYAKFVNDKLFLEILSRLISKEFFKSMIIENDILMSVISFNYDDRIYYTSVGYMEDIMTGFEKKYVDSIFIK